MESQEKDIIKLRFAVCLKKIIDTHKAKSKENKQKGIEDVKLVPSLRKLTASSTVDFATIQKIASGKKNPAWSTVVLIVDGLNMSMAEWGTLYDNVTSDEVDAFRTSLKKK
jgi:hypothetical protein